MNVFTVSGRSKKFLETFARIGFSAKGVVYCLLAVLSVMAAFGLREAKDDKKEAFRIIYRQPFGQVLLVILGICLLGYVTFRFFQAFADSDGKGKDVKAILKRLGYAISGLLYLGISFFAFKTAFGSSSDGDSKKMLIQKVMEYPGGRLVIGLIGAIVIGQGIYQIYRGISKKFMKKIELYRSDYKKTFEKIAIVGLVARGLVLLILGYFFVRAGLDANAGEAEDTGGAFHFLQEKGGNWLLGLVATGLLAYGIFMFVRAKHERISFKV